MLMIENLCVLCLVKVLTLILNVGNHGDSPSRGLGYLPGLYRVLDEDQD